MSKIPTEARKFNFGYKVYGWKNVYTLSNGQAKGMQNSYTGEYYENTYGKNANSFYNKNYAYPNGLPSLACPLGFSLYNNIFTIK